MELREFFSQAMYLKMTIFSIFFCNWCVEWVRNPVRVSRFEKREIVNTELRLKASAKETRWEDRP